MTTALAAAVLSAAAVIVAMPASTRARLLRLPRRDSGLHLAHRFRRVVTSRLSGRGRSRRHRARCREAVAAVAAELRAGQPVHQALERGCTPQGVATHALRALEWNGDVATALRADATVPGCALLASVAACWSVAQGRGAGLAAALERLVEADRAAEDVRSQLDAHLAAPRATARMLATLPILGLLIGITFGGDPVGWLLGSPIGFACLVGGLILIGLGLLWTARIVARVERLL